LFTSEKYRAAAEYGAYFTPIFEYGQLAPFSAGETRSDDDKDSELDRRIGDKKRYQAKLSELLKTAKERVDTVQNAVDQSTFKAGKTKRGLIKNLPMSRRRAQALLLHSGLGSAKCHLDVLRLSFAQSVTPGAHGQGIDADATKTGFSILTAMGRPPGSSSRGGAAWVPCHAHPRRAC